MEDIKKILYAGASAAVLNGAKQSNIDLLAESSKRFGRDRIFVSISSMEEFLPNKEKIDACAGTVLLLDTIADAFGKASGLPVLVHTEEGGQAEAVQILQNGNVSGISGSFVSARTTEIRALKAFCAAKGIDMEIPASRIAWKDFKLDANGLIPVVVQDDRTDAVLMVAYMNEEAFEKTLEIGRMTYWSRSRNELWIKGLTSGHFQYVKSLKLDCDHDTILARVEQIGAACHTGSYSCFFNELYTSPGRQEKNPLRVFEDVYRVIEDRREHPKEGSYTNYLFDKGIDKILKKVGEENTEIIIAAKNPDSSEIKYEIADYLYHLMVLMAERGVSWEEITNELSRR